MNKDEVAALYQRWFKPVRKFLQSRGAHAETADDLAQEVFIRLMKYGKSEKIESIDAYIFQIAANVHIEWHERSVNRRPHDSDLLDDLVEPERPDTSTESQDAGDAFERCLKTLPARRADVFRLHMEGRTYKQIGAELNLTERTVLREITRAYAVLRGTLRNDSQIAPSESVLRARRIQLQQKTSKPAQMPINSHSVTRVLKSCNWVVRKAADLIGMSQSTFRRHVVELIPEYDKKRREFEERLRAAREASRPQKVKRDPIDAAIIIETLTATGFNMRAAAKLLQRSPAGFHFCVHKFVPDFEQRRAAYIAERTAERKAMSARSWQQELKRRSQFLTEFNNKRFSADRAIKDAARVARLEVCEEQRIAIHQHHDQENTALTLEEEIAVAKLRREFKERRDQIRQRQSADLRRITVLIDTLRKPLVEKRTQIAERRAERRARQDEKIKAALDACGGKVRTASRLLGGFNPLTIRRYKYSTWLSGKSAASQAEQQNVA